MKVNEHRGAPMGTIGEGCQCVCGCYCSCGCSCIDCDQAQMTTYASFNDYQSDAGSGFFADVSGSDNNDPA